MGNEKTTGTVEEVTVKSGPKGPYYNIKLSDGKKYNTKFGEIQQCVGQRIALWFKESTFDRDGETFTMRWFSEWADAPGLDAPPAAGNMLERKAQDIAQRAGSGSAPAVASACGPFSSKDEMIFCCGIINNAVNGHGDKCTTDLIVKAATAARQAWTRLQAPPVPKVSEAAMEEMHHREQQMQDQAAQASQDEAKPFDDDIPF